MCVTKCCVGTLKRSPWWYVAVTMVTAGLLVAQSAGNTEECAELFASLRSLLNLRDGV